MILSRLITSAEVYHAVIDYLDGRIWGLLFSFPFLALRSFLVGITRTKALNVAALTAVLVNIPGNLAAHIPLGHGGIAGLQPSHRLLPKRVHWSVLTIHVLRKMDRRLYGLYWNFDKGLLHHVCRVSVWSMFHSFIGVASWLAFFVAVEHLGEMELGSYQCHTQCLDGVLCHRQFAGGYYRFAGKQFVGSRTKETGYPAM